MDTVKIISCSFKSKNIHVSIGMMKKIQVINNGYDFDKINLLTNQKINFKIGMLARWDPQKDYVNLANHLLNFQRLPIKTGSVLSW